METGVTAPVENTTLEKLTLRCSEWLTVLPQRVTKQSGDDIGEEQGSYIRDDELITSR